MRIIAFLVSIILFNNAFSQELSPGWFEFQTDVGNPKIKGSSSFNLSENSYTLLGGGYNIWFGRDEFHYLFREMEGDFVLTATFEFIGKGTDPHRKTGWMLRADTAADSKHISATIHGDGLTVLQWRNYRGASMRDPQDQLYARGSNYQVIQIERRGKVITMRAAKKGEEPEIVGSYEMMTMPDRIIAGLFICSHNADVVEQVKITDVSIVQGGL